MSGIYISGLEMPKRGEFSHVRIYDNGEVTIESNGIEYPVAKAVAVPDHGRLIDADALLLHLLTAESGKVYYYCYPCKEVIQAINEMPTIIPAEEDET
jgi:hypothetical protein